MILFISNAKEFINIQGLLLISILLMIMPAVISILKWESYKPTKLQSFFLVIIPLILLNYIYYIRMGVPVGFNDVHNHIMQYMHLFSNDGTIKFVNANTMSYNFVGLYIIAHFLTQLTNLNIIILASLVPPLFNIITIITMYIIVNRIHSHRVALLAMMLFGWENQVLIFGQEFRTQTLGILILFSILFFQYANLKKSVYVTFIVILLLFSEVMFSFAMIFNTSLLFIAILSTTRILYIPSKSQNNRFMLTWNLFGIYLIFFISYLLHISDGFRNIISSIVTMFNQMMHNTETTEMTITVVSSKAGQSIYGDFVQISTYLFWMIFILASIFYIMHFIKNRKLDRALFFTTFGLLLGYMFLNTLFGVLSAGRIYSITFILMATVVSFGFLKLEDKNKAKSIDYVIKFCVCFVIIIFITSSTVKIPNYIIGPTNPIRSTEPIDYVHYWNSDLPQYAAGNYIAFFATNQSLNLNMLTRKYFIMQHKLENNHKEDKLILLHDKFYGKQYTYRDHLSESGRYNQLNTIYSNADYIIFKNR